MKTTATLIALTHTFLLAGCNTVKGVGQDIGKAALLAGDYSADQRMAAFLVALSRRFARLCTLRRKVEGRTLTRPRTSPLRPKTLMTSSAT